jgi:large subunit ribosomal protein L17
MRHRVAGKRLNRSSGHRRALFRNLAAALFYHERIETTEAKARAVRPLAEKLVTKARKARPARVIELAKQGDVAKLSTWFNARRAGQLIELADQGDEEGLQQMAGELTVHVRRQVLAALSDRKVVSKLVEEIAPRYEDRAGGYTRIVKLGPRRGDAAPMAVLELVEE